MALFCLSSPGSHGYLRPPILCVVLCSCHSHSQHILFATTHYSNLAPFTPFLAPVYTTFLCMTLDPADLKPLPFETIKEVEERNAQLTTLTNGKPKTALAQKVVTNYHKSLWASQSPQALSPPILCTQHRSFPLEPPHSPRQIPLILLPSSPPPPMAKTIQPLNYVSSVSTLILFLLGPQNAAPITLPPRQHRQTGPTVFRRGNPYSHPLTKICCFLLHPVQCLCNLLWTRHIQNMFICARTVPPLFQLARCGPFSRPCGSSTCPLNTTKHLPVFFVGRVCWPIMTPPSMTSFNLHTERISLPPLYICLACLSNPFARF